ncbi:MAG: hypothetical protein M1834_004977 [Cirrosporium novae-zelandiae]|nr:MAG: hypothetical protein M1834_004977 [Cirrosporium novae-zelandiae]
MLDLNVHTTIAMLIKLILASLVALVVASVDPRSLSKREAVDLGINYVTFYVPDNPKSDAGTACVTEDLGIDLLPCSSKEKLKREDGENGYVVFYVPGKNQTENFKMVYVPRRQISEGKRDVCIKREDDAECFDRSEADETYFVAG